MPCATKDNDDHMSLENDRIFSFHQPLSTNTVRFSSSPQFTTQPSPAADRSVVVSRPGSRALPVVSLVVSVLRVSLLQESVLRLVSVSTVDPTRVVTVRRVNVTVGVRVAMGLVIVIFLLLFLFFLVLWGVQGARASSVEGARVTGLVGGHEAVLLPLLLLLHSPSTPGRRQLLVLGQKEKDKHSKQY